MFQSVMSQDLLDSLQTLNAVQCHLLTFAPQHAKQLFTEAEAVLNGTCIFDTALCFSKVVQDLKIYTKSNMLELVEASPSAAALPSL